MCRLLGLRDGKVAASAQAKDPKLFADRQLSKGLQQLLAAFASHTNSYADASVHVSVLY